jgi:hypothetical protein
VGEVEEEGLRRKRKAGEAKRKAEEASGVGSTRDGDRE